MANNPYVNKVIKSDGTTIMDISDSTVTADKLAQGYTAHNSAGELITGTATIKPLELGLRADFANNTFTRLGDAVGLSGGSDFDNFPMYKRRRCNLADNGTVNAYLGDADFAVDGSNGQVMVEQPKFYYKVTPITTGSEYGSFKSLTVVEYWVSNEPLEGYKLHPAFKNTALQEIDYFYEGAYEAYEDSNLMYSISNVNCTYYGTRSRHRTRAANRGTGWYQETIWSLSADQLLMIIEYACFNMQNAIGNGINASPYTTTGGLNSYGNGTYGNKNDYSEFVQWRGKENPWGSVSTFVDGVNIVNGNFYIANTYSFSDDTTTGYINTSAYPGSWKNYDNYISRFGYYVNGSRIWAYDWLFAPKTVGTNSSLPVGDVCTYSQSDTYGTYLAGGAIQLYKETASGAFYIEKANSSSYGGSRLLYVG